MCREVSSAWDADKMLAPWEVEPGGNCWFVWMLAGDAREAIGKLPHVKPFIAFERENELRIVAAEKFLNRLHRSCKYSTARL